MTEEITVAQTYEEAEYDKSVSLSRDSRRNSYPSINDQLDMIWNDMKLDYIQGKDTEYYNTILSVKTELPLVSEE